MVVLKRELKLRMLNSTGGRRRQVAGSQLQIVPLKGEQHFPGVVKRKTCRVRNIQVIMISYNTRKA